MKILAIVSPMFFLTASCAITLTDEEAASCKGNQPCLTEALDRKIETAEWTRIEARDAKEDKLRTFILGCNNAKGVLLQKGHSVHSRKPLIDRDGVVHLPRHAMRADYECVRPQDLADILCRSGLGC